MKVSVIVTIHPNAAYVREALAALEKQSLRDFEALLLDDGTCAQSVQAAQAMRDKRFRLLHLPGLSLAQARNAALREAKGTYVTFLDAKDYYSRHYLEQLVDTAQRLDCALTVGRMRSFDLFGTHVFSSTTTLSRRSVTSPFDPTLLWTPSVTNKLFLRRRIAEMGLEFTEHADAQDALFSLRFALQCAHIGAANRGFVEFRGQPFSPPPDPEADLEGYLEVYRSIAAQANEAFARAIETAQTDFDKQELAKQEGTYIDEVHLKLMTVLLYKFCRRVYDYPESFLHLAAQVLLAQYEKLSSTGKRSFTRANADVLDGAHLPSSRTEVLQNARLSIVLSGTRTKKQLDEQLRSLFGQQMPGFKLFVDEKLREAFLPEYLFADQVQFLSADSDAQLKTLALQQATTPYILFLDEPCVLDKAFTQRHINVLVKSPKAGFSASPLAQADETGFQEYRSATLSFYNKPAATRSKDSAAFVLDLALCNKVFRAAHLAGIKFHFSDNVVLDAYQLYSNASFTKLLFCGVYLPVSEEAFLLRLRAQEKLLPPECAAYYRRLPLIYLREVSLRQGIDRARAGLFSLKRAAFTWANHAVQGVCRRLPLRDRIVFYSIRSDGKLIENSKCLYDVLPGKKVIVAHTLPHRFEIKPRIYYYLMTSKIIIADDYVRYLRVFRLREEQRMFQVWHAAGAFKRFALDAPIPYTRLEEIKTHAQYSAVAVSSEGARQYYAHAFGVSPDIVLPIGMPRTDELLDEEKREKTRQAVYKRHPKLKGKKVYLYCPTFRDKDGEKVAFDPQINWKALQEGLQEDEMFLIHRHPVMRETYLRNKHYPNIRDYTAEPTSDLLCVCDVLVTDYSSVFYDAVLMGLPVVFYCPDLAGFERDFYIRYPEDLPGPAVQTAEKLLPVLRDTLAKGPDEKNLAFCAAQLSACDGHATERARALILDWMRELYKSMP